MRKMTVVPFTRLRGNAADTVGFMPNRRNLFSWVPTLPMSARFGLAAGLGVAMLAGCASSGAQRVTLQSATEAAKPTTPTTVKPTTTTSTVKPTTTTTAAVYTYYGSITMGPQAMEGNVANVKNGNVLIAGYDFSQPGTHAASTVSFFFPPGPPTAFDFKYTCNSGEGGDDRPASGDDSRTASGDDSRTASGDIYVAPPNQVYHSIANNGDWIPTANQKDASGYQGKTTLATNCGKGTVNLSKGGTFKACITEQTTDSKPDPINVRWHYSILGSPGTWSTTSAVVLSKSHYANGC